MKVQVAGVAAGLLGTAAILAACSSSAPTTGAEHLSANIGGKAAVAALESNDSNFTFPKIVWTGVVNTHESPGSLGGGNPKGGTHTFKTAAGDFAVEHYTANPNGVTTVTGPSHGYCSFRIVQSGTFRVLPKSSSGQFAGATGSGKYTLNLLAIGPAQNGVCKNTSNGPTVTGISGAGILFSATTPALTK